MCKDCSVELTPENTRTVNDKLYHRCRACESKNVVRVRKKKHGERANTVMHARTRYGLTLEEYDAIVSQPCRICEAKDDIVVDHDHATGKLRGPLCRRCNQGLGMFRDNVEFLANAVEYLRCTI